MPLATLVVLVVLGLTVFVGVVVVLSGLLFVSALVEFGFGRRWLKRKLEAFEVVDRDFALEYYDPPFIEPDTGPDCHKGAHVEGCRHHRKDVN
jgi:hypothetical protein